MSHRTLNKFIAPGLLACAAILPFGLSTGCGSDEEKSPTKATASNATIEDRRVALKTELSDIQLRLTELEQTLTDMRKDQDRALEDVARSTKAINEDFVRMKAEALALSLGETTVAQGVNVDMLAPSDPAVIAIPTPTSVESAPAREGLSPFVRILVWGLVIVAIGFFVRLFIARKDEEFDDYDLAEDAPDVKLNEYGTVQMPREGAAPAPDVSGDDDIEHPDRR